MVSSIDGSKDTAAYHFDEFSLDIRNRILKKDDEELALSSRYFDALVLLIQNAGKLVTKQQLFEHIWDGVHVTDAALTQCIKDIRKVLGDPASSPRFIKTAPKQGYSFIGQLHTKAGKQEETQTINRPYKSLSSFTESDASLFFGREMDIPRLLSQISANQTFLLYGRSGAGKSSLLAAGLIPALKQKGCAVRRISVSEDPLGDVRRALSKGSGEEVTNPLLGISTHLEEHPTQQLVLCFDQTENIFRLATESRLDVFMSWLAEALDLPGAERLRFVFVLREDYLAAMSALKKVFPTIFHAELRLGLLTRDQAERAMTEPARLCGCRFEDGLAGAILDDLGKEQGIDPPFLQIICDRLYDARTSDAIFSLDAYRRLGEAAGILEHYLDRVLLRLGNREVIVARQLLLSLISPDGARLTRPLGPICDQVARDYEVSEVDVRSVLEELAESRIVLVRSEPGEVWVELIHDYLITPVSQWITDESLALSRVRDVLTRAERNFEEQGLLMSREELELVLKVGAALRPSATAADLLVKACFSRTVAAPEWLAKLDPEFPDRVQEALDHKNDEIRLNAIKMTTYLEGEVADPWLSKTAMFDTSPLVRKHASIALAARRGDRSVSLLHQNRPPGFSGLWRFLIALAVIRDADRKHFNLFGHGAFIGLAVTCGLAIVYLRRGQSYAFHQVSTGAVGGALGSSFYTLCLALTMSSSDAALAFISVGAFTGLALGGGITAAMVFIELITNRRDTWLRIPFAVMGGSFAAHILYLVSQAVGQTFVGIDFPDVGGWREGIFLAGGASVGGLMPWPKGAWPVLGAAVGAGSAAVVATALGGDLLPASLQYIGRQLASSWQPMALSQMDALTRSLVSFAEGALFGAGWFSALYWRRLRNLGRLSDT